MEEFCIIDAPTGQAVEDGANIMQRK